jgi:hypothetical protein
VLLSIRKAVDSRNPRPQKKQKPWVPRFAYPWFQSVSGPVRLLRPTGRLAEKEASPKTKKAKVKKPENHHRLLN